MVLKCRIGLVRVILLAEAQSEGNQTPVVEVEEDLWAIVETVKASVVPFFSTHLPRIIRD